MKVKHEIFESKSKEEEKIKTFIWKLELNNGKPMLSASGDNGRSFFWIFRLSLSGKWMTNGAIVRHYPEVFAQKIDSTSSRTLCMWDEKATKEGTLG